MTIPRQFWSIGVSEMSSFEEVKSLVCELAVWALNQEYSSFVIRLNDKVFIDRVDGQMMLKWDAHKCPHWSRPFYFKNMQEEFSRICKLKAFA